MGTEALITLADMEEPQMLFWVEEADLVITQSAETFEKTIRGIQPLPEAIQEGAVGVSDMESLAILGELFPMEMS